MWEFAGEFAEGCFRDREQRHVKRLVSILKHFVFREARDF